jgi:transposase
MDRTENPVSPEREREALEHSRNLRRAIGQADLHNDDIATAVGVSVRTVVNWTSKTAPTMPSEKYQERLRRTLPGYADAGDLVDIAIDRAELAPFRRAELKAVYARLLHEQAREDKATG